MQLKGKTPIKIKIANPKQIFQAAKNRLIEQILVVNLE